MRKLRNLTVMVTAAGAQFTPGLFRCLRENGERDIRIIGVDCDEDATIKQMVDVVYKVPKVSDAGYVDSLLAICHQEHVDVLLPSMSAELPLLIGSKDKFQVNGTHVSVGSAKAVSTCLSKLRLYEFMQSHDIPTPKYHAIRSLKEFDEALEYIGYPNHAVCIKATQLSGSRGIRIIDPKKSRFDILFGEKPNSLYTTYDELHSILSEKESDMPEIMAMECLTGEEFSVDILADHGKVLYMCGRRSETIVASIPQSATLFEDTRAYEIVTRLTEVLGLDGNADFDFRYNSEGVPVLMECNPRIAATMEVFKAGGLNLPYLRIKQLVNDPLPDIKARLGTKMKRRYVEMFC